MHSIKGGLVAHTYALASNNESGGKKSRLRRSKEERRSMVKSFVKKYQKSNDGKFPSLNLTHKEVGGSFYSVREIFREIIQENRVLAPPKEGDDHFELLEQHPLGSISPEINFSLSHSNASIEYPFQGEDISSSVMMLHHESDASKSENEHLIDGIRMESEKDNGLDITGHSFPNHCQHTTLEEDSNFSEQLRQPKAVLQENADSYKPRTTSDVPMHNLENNGKDLEFSRVSSESEKQKLVDVQRINPGQTVDKTEEHINESEVRHIVNIDPSRANDLDPSKVVESHANSNVVVETFPLRPIPKISTSINGESGNVQEFIMTDEVKHASSLNSSGSGNKNDKKTQDEISVLTVQKPSLESAKHSSYSDHSNAVGSKAVKDTSASTNQSNPPLNRVHLETWKGASKKPTEPETNPLLALIDALVSAFVKLWT